MARWVNTISGPTFVLVHGAWHSPAHFESLINSLTEHGYKAVAPNLPSMANAHISPSTDCTEDARTIRETILTELESADVIVVPHSYGGIPTTSALKGLDTLSRTAAGQHKTSVVAIAALTSFIIPAGTDMRQAEQRPPLNAAEMPATLDPPPLDIFFHELPDAEKEKWTAMLKPMASAALVDKCHFSAHEVIPLHYLMAGADKAIPLETQERMVDTLRSTAVGEIRTEMVEGCGHAPFLSRVEETVAFLRRTAGETV
ncbi:hypothetical protein LTR96_010361 [Exophiala xenobiotica]|nr:hypothetical protein LTR92_008694 [Exophiala xenobiotica]KAK5264344.1 hypothetical protein LTR96_010361 [Exophiala xenobiotica]KAK5333250.1 hypothetical protein LTR98_010644 [Exophiala xenobiotica]KAK5554092.1 hypothetical protein LTR46_007739 [Exophiala xenobiotica]